jgi:hypothetical protein
MAFKKWVSSIINRKRDQTDNVIALPSAEEMMEGEANGLNFHTAIQAHQKWKIRLQAVINHDSAEDLSVDVVCRDDQCVLGKWIHGMGGERFGHSDMFQRLQHNHAQFHVCAGKVLALAQEGKKEEAQDALKSDAYAKASKDVIFDLAHMYNEVTDKQAA